MATKKKLKKFSVTKAVKSNARDIVGQPKPAKVIDDRDRGKRSAGAAQGDAGWPDRRPGGGMMAKVTGVGGIFLRAKDPEALYSWYEKHLGISRTS